jgi:penicillin-binding protein 1A
MIAPLSGLRRFPDPGAGQVATSPCDMTDDFDFDFDVERGRSASRTKNREPDEATPVGDDRKAPEPDFGFEQPEPPEDPPERPRSRGTRGRLEPGNGVSRTRGNGNGARGYADRARDLLKRGSDLVYGEEENGRSQTDDDQGDWLSMADDGRDAPDLDSLTEHDDGPAGPRTPREGRNFAKEARRRASRRPSPLLDLDVDDEVAPEPAEPENAEVDFESLLERQPQKSGVARGGSAVRSALRGGLENLRRVGSERIAESRERIAESRERSRERMVAFRERVPARVPTGPARPGTQADGDGAKVPPPRLPRRISSRRPRKPEPGRVKKVRIAIILAGLGLLAIVSTFFGMMMAISQDLPQLENKQEFAQAKNSEVFDDQGNKIGTLLSNNQRILTGSEDISPYMKEATVAIEDRRFYEHRGVDIQGMARAGLADLIPGGSTQGASTITEQFVKNALEAQGSRTVFQKFREAALAYQLERHWDKDKILTEYLNTVYFGEGAYGIEAAARTYFGYAHPGCGQSGGDACAKELTPPEAAMLAGIITSPSAFSPRADPQAALDRRNLVLEKMKDEGDIDETEYEDSIHQALPAPSEIARPESDSLAPYFTDWLRQQVVDLYGPGRAFGGGLDIHTSLDLEMQQTAEEIAGGELSGIAPTASLVVLDNKTAAVKAMVGGYDFQKEPFNIATQGHRQPGSAFKPFTLATALQHGFSPSSCFSSQPKEFPVPGVSPKKEVFQVHNYEDKYLGGCVSLSTATEYSDNSVFAELGVGRDGLGPKGPREIAHTAEEMGIQTHVSDNPAMVLGGLEEGVTPLEMAHAYNTIANDGARVSGNLDTVPGNDKNDPDQLGPVAIDEIDGPDGKAIAKNKTIKDQVIPSNVATTMQSMMSLVVSGGTGQLASSADYGKTGTTENNGDAWFCGVDENFTACVWVGHRDSTQGMNTEYNGGPVDGGTYPAIIWNAVINALEGIHDSHEASKDSDSGDDSESDSGSSYSGSSGGSSGSSSSSGGGGGGNSGSDGGRSSSPAPAPSGGGGGGGAVSGGGTGGTGL